MKEAIHQLLLGAGSIFLAPLGLLPPPALRITMQSATSSQALAYDFAQVAGDFQRAIRAEEKRTEPAEQLELQM